jgi:hypothetical protein
MANQDLLKQTTKVPKVEKQTKTAEQIRQFAAIVTDFENASISAIGKRDRKVTSVEGKPSNHFRVDGVDVKSLKDGRYTMEDYTSPSGVIVFENAISVLAHIQAKENEKSKFFSDLKRGNDL